MTLSCLALVAGCKTGEGSLDTSGYLSPFGAPAPVDSSVLAAFFADAMLPSVVTQTAALFVNDARYYGQSTTNWSHRLNSGQALTGLNSSPLRSSGAAFAHVAGLTGNGSTIAVSDGQYIPGYAEFAGSNVLIVNNWEASDNNPLAQNGHGTIVAAVALGDSTGFVGTAPDAQLIFGSYGTDQKLADLGNVALSSGAVAWNNSWSYRGLFLNQTGFDIAFNRDQGSRAYLTSLDNFAASGVVVFAVSNDDTLQHSNLLDALPYLRPSLEAGWIAAANGVPTFTGNNVSSVQLISSDCNEAAR